MGWRARPGAGTLRCRRPPPRGTSIIATSEHEAVSRNIKRGLPRCAQQRDRLGGIAPCGDPTDDGGGPVAERAQLLDARLGPVPGHRREQAARGPGGRRATASARINARVNAFLRRGPPVVSVGTTKKGLVKEVFPFW